jgi:hypothetical protein
MIVLHGFKNPRYLRDGIGSSHRAIAAAKEGRVPLSKISAEIENYPVYLEFFKTKKQAKEWIVSRWDGEWHHTGKYGNSTNFYDVAGLAQELEDYLSGESDELPGIVENPPKHKKNYSATSIPQPKSARDSATIYYKNLAQQEKEKILFPMYFSWEISEGNRLWIEIQPKVHSNREWEFSKEEMDILKNLGYSVKWTKATLLLDV